MAQRVEITLEDDLDGLEAAETVRFSLDRSDYEIDLSSEHAEQLRSAFSPFVDASRAIAKGREKATRSAPKRSTSNAGVIRAWAQENGIDVNSRGRINEDVVNQFHAAH